MNVGDSPRQLSRVCGCPLIEGRVDAAWARWVRPWALALSILTLTCAPQRTVLMGCLGQFYRPELMSSEAHL